MNVVLGIALDYVQWWLSDGLMQVGEKAVVVSNGVTNDLFSKNQK